jgi:ribosomal protein S18 acetylase RimI-like enzyme
VDQENMNFEKELGKEKVSNITIERASSEDVKELVLLHKKVFSDTYPEFPKLHTHEEDLNHFTEVIQGEQVHVAKLAERIVGYIAFGKGEISKLYIDPEFQGQGLGEKLVDIAKSQNEHLVLWTFQENKKARGFYERLGFVATKETDGSENEEKQPDVMYEWREE